MVHGIARLTLTASALLAFHVGAFSTGGPAEALTDDDNTGWMTTKTSSTLSVPVTNTCYNGGEEVQLQINSVFWFSTRTHDGRKDVRLRVLWHGDGFGLSSGVRYKLEELGRIYEQFGIPPDLSATFTDRDTQKLKGQGVPDQTVLFYSQFAFDANGNFLPGEIFELNTTCR